VRLPLRRGYIGAGHLGRVFAAVENLPRPDEDPRTGRGQAEFGDVKVRDLARPLNKKKRGIGCPRVKPQAALPGFERSPGFTLAGCSGIWQLEGTHQEVYSSGGGTGHALSQPL